MKLFIVLSLVVLPLCAREPLEKRIAHTDPSKYKAAKGVHNGAGQLDYSALFGSEDFSTNLIFLHLHPQPQGRHFDALAPPFTQVDQDKNAENGKKGQG